jgi:hypothetical protein
MKVVDALDRIALHDTCTHTGIPHASQTELRRGNRSKFADSTGSTVLPWRFHDGRNQGLLKGLDQPNWLIFR